MSLPRRPILPKVFRIVLLGLTLIFIFPVTDSASKIRLQDQP